MGTLPIAILDLGCHFCVQRGTKHGGCQRSGPEGPISKEALEDRTTSPTQRAERKTVIHATVRVHAEVGNIFTGSVARAHASASHTGPRLWVQK
jgi:hypothetical protein